jgi:hypothetical protein
MSFGKKKRLCYLLRGLHAAACNNCRGIRQNSAARPNRWRKNRVTPPEIAGALKTNVPRNERRAIFSEFLAQ